LVCITLEKISSAPFVVQSPCVTIFASFFLSKVIQTSAHHGADGTQVSRDEYNKFKQDYNAQHGDNKHSVMLAASALVAVAGEPESELDDSQIEAPVRVATADRSSSAPAQTGEPIEQAARAVATGLLQDEITSILAGKQEKPSRELINGVKQISKLVFKQGTFVVYGHKASDMQGGRHRPLASSCKKSSWSDGRRKTATWATTRQAYWASARRGRAP
jgi:hypothetical protein